MKKINNKGFLLLETLVVGTFIVLVLTYLYVQYINLKKNYNKSFSYNNVTSLYHAKEIDKFINDNNFYTPILSAYVNSSNRYVELAKNSTCSTTFFSSKITYCKQLLEKSNIKTILLLPSDISRPVNSLNSYNPYSNSFLTYIKSIKIKKSSARYTLAIEFKNDTYANILIEE